MAEHASSAAHGAAHASDAPVDDFQSHVETYRGFIKGAIALSLLCGYILVALVCFRFAHTWNVFTGFAGLIVGHVAVAIDARAGSRWMLSLILLVLFGLFVAYKVS